MSKTSNILRGILKTRGMDGGTIAKATRMPQSTVNRKIQYADRLQMNDFRMLIQIAGMTDQEIVHVVRGK